MLLYRQNKKPFHEGKKYGLISFISSQTRENILTKMLKFFLILAEFWLKSYFFQDFRGVSDETGCALHLFFTNNKLNFKEMDNFRQLGT